MLLHVCSNIVVIICHFDSFLHQKCLSDSPKDIYYRSQTGVTNPGLGLEWDRFNLLPHVARGGTVATFYFLRIAAGVGALSAFKMLADSCWACSKLRSVLLGSSDNIDDLDAIGIYANWPHPFSAKSCIMLAFMTWLKSWLCSKLCWHKCLQAYLTWNDVVYCSVTWDKVHCCWYGNMANHLLLCFVMLLILPLLHFRPMHVLVADKPDMSFL